MDTITRKTHAWAAQRFGFDLDKIEAVEFTSVPGGYCETCSYDTCGVEIRYNGSYQEFETGNLDVAEVVREISAMEV